jgi:hypothetical protein
VEIDGVIGVRKTFWEQKENIKSMLSQISEKNGEFILSLGHVRKDGEQWTPYLQIIKMLILMGEKLGLVSYEGKLEPTTKIKLLWQEEK